MKYAELGATGWKVSRACLGTMTWGSQNSEAEGHAQLNYALERGINMDVPIAVAIAISTIITIMIEYDPVFAAKIVANKMATGIDSFSLLAA